MLFFANRLCYTLAKLTHHTKFLSNKFILDFEGRFFPLSKENALEKETTVFAKDYLS